MATATPVQPSTEPAATPAAPAPAFKGGVDSSLGFAIREFKDTPIKPIPEKSAPPAAEPLEAGSTAASDAAASAVGTSAGSETAVPPPPSKFAFGGVEFESQEKAEHSFKTLRGMHAAKDRELSAAKVRALELEVELQRLKNTPKHEDPPPVAPGKGQAAAAPKGDLSQEDTYAVFEVLKEKFGQKFAQGWLDEQNETRVQSRVEKLVEAKLAELSEKFNPVLESHAQQAEAREMTGVFEKMSQFTLSDGSEAYPELKDATVMRDVGLLWRSLGQGIEGLKTERGVHLAIVSYRDAMAQRARLGKTTRTSVAPPPVAVDPGVSSAAGDSPGRHPSHPVPTKTAGDELTERLLNASVGYDKTLGYTPRKY